MLSPEVDTSDKGSGNYGPQAKSGTLFVQIRFYWGSTPSFCISYGDTQGTASFLSQL